MHGDQMILKDRIEKIAQKAVMISQDTDCSLTDAVIKSALDHGLNPYEWEHVCHRVNHIVFKNKYAEDKLAAFNIANHKDVAAGINPQEKVAKNLVETQPDTIIAKGHPKIESEPIPEEVTRGRELTEGSNIAEAGERNADILNSLNIKRDRVYDQIYNTVRSLVQSGESLKDIHEVLLKSWGSHNEKETTNVFDDIVERLKSEGYIPQNTEYEGVSQENLPDRAVTDNELTKSAAELLDINENAINHGLSHLKFVYMLRDKGFSKRADSLSNRVKYNIMDDLIEEYTGWKNGVSESIKIAGIESSLSKAVSAVKGLAKKTDWKGIVSSGFERAKRPLIASAVVYGAGEAYLYAKNKSVKSSLKKRYPELKKIDDKMYSDVFDTLVALNPTLLKTPFALSSLIQKHSTMGVIDTPSITALSGSRGKLNLTSELSKALIQSLMPARTVETYKIEGGKKTLSQIRKEV